MLNSASYSEKAITCIRESSYTNINGYLDNDRAGDNATEKFKAEFGNAFADMRMEYQAFKDLNEFLKSG